MARRYASPSDISSAFGRGYGAAAIGLSISVVSKRGCLPSLGYLVHDIADVDGGFSQPAQRYEALVFLAVDISSGIFPAARSHDFADQLTVGWSRFLRLQPDLDQAADGFGTADLLALCLDPIIDRFQLLIMHADDLRLARTSCLRAAHFWIGLRGITN
jgi:hypothetical protein